VTSPVFPPVTPNMGIISAPFMVRAFSGKNEVTVPFLAFSSNGALGISFSACSGAKPSVQFGTPTPLGACLDTAKIVRGRYAFVLTVHYQKLQGPTNEPEGISEPRDAVRGWTATPRRPRPSRMCMQW